MGSTPRILTMFSRYSSPGILSSGRPPAGLLRNGQLLVLSEACGRSTERTDDALMKVRFQADADLNQIIVAATTRRAAEIDFRTDFFGQTCSSRRS